MFLDQDLEELDLSLNPAGDQVPAEIRPATTPYLMGASATPPNPPTKIPGIRKITFDLEFSAFSS
ncbi:uncharacterized protein QC763_0104830 [Podospora pseudopauciseta]|uniref:Uncharacterized protein n=2 Tax=Podospora TaxID=5144 RepID=A0ABR0H161_9PEZI|nr:hypothetical protein QC763_0104830 [Podospora pseudopauciseta]KAK4668228.1 hypothetical protein QC764_0114260 [Podospora pseudoanserina]